MEQVPSHLGLHGVTPSQNAVSNANCIFMVQSRKGAIWGEEGILGEKDETG